MDKLDLNNFNLLLFFFNLNLILRPKDFRQIFARKRNVAGSFF